MHYDSRILSPSPSFNLTNRANSIYFSYHVKVVYLIVAMLSELCLCSWTKIYFVMNEKSSSFLHLIETWNEMFFFKSNLPLTTCALQVCSQLSVWAEWQLWRAGRIPIFISWHCAWCKKKWEFEKIKFFKICNIPTKQMICIRELRSLLTPWP